MKKRRSIRRKVSVMVMLIAAIVAVLVGGLGIYHMQIIRSTVLAEEVELGDTVSELSRSALQNQVLEDIENIVQTNAQLTDAKLSVFDNAVSHLARAIHNQYVRTRDDPEKYPGNEILPPNDKDCGTYTMQRTLAARAVTPEDIQGDMAALSYMEPILNAIITENSDMISTIYIGTESGLLVSYDLVNYGGPYDGSEEYYYYFTAAWYENGKNATDAFFTETYFDSFNRGLVVTCAAPFTDADGNFAGVVGMDILITDLVDSVVKTSVGEGSKAFLLDKDGNILAYPGMDYTSDTLHNIYNIAPQSAADDITSGDSGITFSDGDYIVYYPISTSSWSFAVYIPASLVNGPGEYIRTEIESSTDNTLLLIDDDVLYSILHLFAIIAAVLVLALVVSYYFSRRLTDPILKLQKDVKKMSSGDLKHRVSNTSNDEVGDLADAFNDMAGSLDNYINDLTHVTAEKERISTELNVATQIQASMLPQIFPDFCDKEQFRIYATMNPAKEVGGDFYDFFMVDETHLAFVMADVSGKGVPAALFMVIGKTLIKDHTTPGRDLAEVFTEVNSLLCQSNSEDLFITAFEAVLDLESGELRYVNAGHEIPFIAPAGEPYKPYKISAGFVLAGMDGVRYRSGSLVMNDGDRIFQYTDGVTEATSSSNELYGMERLEKVLSDNTSCSPLDLLPKVKEDIDAFVGDAPQFDDITMLCLEYHKK